MIYRSLAIRDPQNDDVDYVVRRMRPTDCAEVYGVRFTADAESLVAEIAAQRDHYATLKILARACHVRPVALIGVLLTSPGAGWANMIATAEWPLIAKDATRWFRSVLVPELTAQGFRRVELRTLASWRGNRAWLERLGARFECPCPGLGPETFVQYAWTLPELMEAA